MQRRKIILVSTGVIAAAVLASVVVVAMRPIVHTRQGNTEAYIRIYAEELEQHRRKVGRYPTTQEWPQVLFEPGRPGKAPWDGWGNPLQYRHPSQRSDVPFELWSYGADGKPGGDAENRDIGNWKQ